MIEGVVKSGDGGRSDYLVICDGRGCKASLDAMDMTFNETVALIKESGWQIRKVNGTWQHRCPKCQKRTQWGAEPDVG